MEEMIDLFREKIKMIVPPQSKILVAVSGGVDSVVLVHLLSLCEIPYAIAHCNFSLRAEESDEDAKFVEQLSQSYNVPFFSIRFNTVEVAEREKTSIQMAARKLRYGWFQTICSENKYDLIATAHHKNDVIETVLLNITRGTGIKGYHGIREKSNNLIRPLLHFDKDTIRSFAVKEGIEYREDSSNASDKYSRNLIRQQVVPVLKQINPSVESTFLENTQRIYLTELFVYEKIDELKSTMVFSEMERVIIDLKPIISKPYFHFILFEVVKSFGFTWQQCQTILPEGQQSGKKIFSSTNIARIDREKLYIEPQQFYINLQKDLAYIGRTSFGNYNFQTEVVENIEIDWSGSQTAFLNYESLNYPLSIRHWQEGDVFWPLGLRGSKKLSDFFIDNKIAVSHKRELPIITSGTDIVWVTGIRIDERFKLLKSSTKVYKITFKKYR